MPEVAFAQQRPVQLVGALAAFRKAFTGDSESIIRGSIERVDSQPHKDRYLSFAAIGDLLHKCLMALVTGAYNSSKPWNQSSCNQTHRSKGHRCSLCFSQTLLKRKWKTKDATLPRTPGVQTTVHHTLFKQNPQPVALGFTVTTAALRIVIQIGLF